MHNDRFIQPELLNNIPGISYGFTTKIAGSFRTDEKVRKNIGSIGLIRKNVIWMKQIHGNTIQFVDAKNSGSKLEDTDGLITKTKGAFLLVKTADCIPIIASEKNGKAVGVVHIGWKGILNDILNNFIYMFESLGINRKDILFSAGPHIQKCCYDVSWERIQLFQNKLGIKAKIWSEKNGKFYLNLSKSLKVQFHNLKINKTSFEISKECTVSLKDKYYSFRREGNTYGEIAGFIGIV